MSGLGEPLNAEIELISTTPEELASLTASIAPAEAYNAQGLERPGISGAIRINIDKSGGTPVLKLSTRQAVTDPFLDMLVQVDWATGRLLREYTILLDPPGYTASSTPDTTSAPAITPQTPAASAVTASANPFADTPPSAATPRTHETARGDTLNEIAREMQVEGVSLEQMLVGLYRANKQAFDGDNMNRLKVGQIIRAPSPDELQAIDQREAAREIRVQTADWNAYRNRLAGMVAEADASAGDDASQSASGKLSGPAEDRSAPPSDAEQDVVKLSKSDSEASDKSLQDRLNALQEEVTARENSLKEANERAAALEQQIQDMQALLEYKNQALADIQQGATEQNAEPPPGNTAGSQVEKPAPTAAQPVVKPAAAAPAASATNLLDDVLRNPLLPAIALAVLAVLAGIWLLLRNKRRRELDSFEKGILTAGGLKANTVFGNTSGNTVDTGDTSFLTDFSQSTGGMIDTHDVDPIAEAEVYMAYGRDAQAEEILKDAIAKEPKRYELHLKLLEIFAARNDAASFETVAGELYATLGATDPIWGKVAETGRRLEPENPLYAIAATDVEPPSIEAASDNLAVEIAEAEQHSAASLDFSLNSDTADTIGNDSETSLFGSDDEHVIADAPIQSSTELPTLDLTPESIDEEKKVDADANSLDFFVAPAVDEPQLDAVRTEASADEATAPAASDDLPAFDVPELTLDTPDTASQPELPPHVQDISLDFPSIDEAETTPQVQAPSDEQQTLPDLAGFEEITSEPEETLSPEEQIVFESIPEQADEDSLETGDEDTERAAPVNLDEIPELDLSSISFDLDDNSKPGEPDTTSTDDLSGESAEVNTKLDLVGAYIDMDDIEGARELLEEVLKEGGPGQRQQAQKLLAGLA